MKVSCRPDSDVTKQTQTGRDQADSDRPDSDVATDGCLRSPRLGHKPAVRGGKRRAPTGGTGSTRTGPIAL